ncbi:hypothetical protein C4565_09910 [Candidatus Parcubacteria bacterium]|nr:MAG: hypothetical protein C4565_09910 [Candidatus Parcubacteria bacterium]
MEVCKHKQTGKYFIYINESGLNEALFVTPVAEIKSLNLEQFDELEDHDEAYLLKNWLIEPEQLRRFQNYRKNRSDEAAEKFKRLFFTMSPSQQKKIIEQLKEEHGL